MIYKECSSTAQEKLMTSKFRKTLSKNDTGVTGSHQAGMAIPKSNTDFLKFLGNLDPKEENPSRAIHCMDEYGDMLDLRFVYYNKKLHGNGTRNEYRLTKTTGYFRRSDAEPGDEVELSKNDEDDFYRIKIIKEDKPVPEEPNSRKPNAVVLRGWREVY